MAIPFKSQCNADENEYYAVASEYVIHTLCPMKRKARNWGLKFHSMMQLSPLPLASCFKVGEKLNELT